MRRAAIVFVLIAAACASGRRSEGHRLFLAGDYAAAASAYELAISDPGARVPDDLLLFRAALAHALADIPARDLDRSSELLQMLLARYPASPHRAAATVMAEMHAQLADSRSRLDTERELHAAALACSDTLERELHAMTTALENAEKNANERAQLAAGLRRDIERLQSEARVHEEHIRALELELSGLKEIDLGQDEP